jgi:hypothetical protein
MGDWRPETGDRRRKTEDRGRRTGERRSILCVFAGFADSFADFTRNTCGVKTPVCRTDRRDGTVVHIRGDTGSCRNRHGPVSQGNRKTAFSCRKGNRMPSQSGTNNRLYRLYTGPPGCTYPFNKKLKMNTTDMAGSLWETDVGKYAERPANPEGLHVHQIADRASGKVLNPEDLHVYSTVHHSGHATPAGVGQSCATMFYKHSMPLASGRKQQPGETSSAKSEKYRPYGRLNSWLMHEPTGVGFCKSDITGESNSGVNDNERAIKIEADN